MSVRINQQLISGVVRGITGTSDPTTSTPAVVGQIYINTSNSKQFICTSASGNTFTWVELAGGGGSASNYDDVSIKLNTDEEMYVHGQAELNSGDIKYDWIGTLAQYEAGRNNNTIPDSYICYITDDNTSINTVVSDVQFNSSSVVIDGVANITDSNIRSVKPSCTVIPASTASTVLTTNSTYAQTPSVAVSYTLPTITDNTEYNGFILMLNTTDNASVLFTTGSPATTVAIEGTQTLETGKSYTITGQYNPTTSKWNLWIIEYTA